MCEVLDSNTSGCPDTYGCFRVVFNLGDKDVSKGSMSPVTSAIWIPL